MIALHELKSVIIDNIKVNHKFIDQNSTMWSDIAPCGQIRLPSPKCRQKGREASDINKGFVFREIYSCLLVLYQNYNHLPLAHAR